MSTPHPQPDPLNPPTSPNDPTYTLLNSTTLDLLLIELVPLAYRITADLAHREEEFLRPTSSARKQGNRMSGTSNDTGAGGPVGGGGGGATATVDDEEAREAVFHRLEGLGYRVGLGIVER